jgi:preprotein translocase subunit SecD
MAAPGALNVVPLPADEYGSVAAPGRTALPAVGDPIDPALPPVARAGGAGLTTAHVDPTTGRRGLAFRLGNKQTDAFLAHATAHPREYVAVVLDGIVLATLSIEGETAKGNFVFTGDYTEAESRLLARYLYRSPIPFPLRLTDEIEVQSR